MKKKSKVKTELNPVPDLQSLYMPDRITEREDCIIINNAFTRILTVDMLPEEVSFGWFSGINSIPGVTVSVTIYPFSSRLKTSGPVLKLCF